MLLLVIFTPLWFTIHHIIYLLINNKWQCSGSGSSQKKWIRIQPDPLYLGGSGSTDKWEENNEESTVFVQIIMCKNVHYKVLRYN